jgi:hypothetical protein
VGALARSVASRSSHAPTSQISCSAAAGRERELALRTSIGATRAVWSASAGRDFVLAAMGERLADLARRLH